MRDPTNIDLSQPIMNWAMEEERRKQPEFANLQSRNMAGVTFGDLELRVGQPYLYRHQGNCEHIVQITDIRYPVCENNARFVHDGDTKDAAAYPIHVFQSKIRRRKCRLCDIYPAKFVTYGDKLSPENPCFYCDRCFKPLHYGPDGKALYDDYDVYQYFHEI